MNHRKGDVYLESGYGILSPIFFVQITWKIDIVEGLDASLRCISFKPYLLTFILSVSIKSTQIFTIMTVKAFTYH